jgi:hypothetical protein
VKFSIPNQFGFGSLSLKFNLAATPSAGHEDMQGACLMGMARTALVSSFLLLAGWSERESYIQII